MVVDHAVRQDASSARSRRRSATATSASTRPTTATIIRVVFPQLTEERRREFIKVARHKAEDAKISIRNIRRHAKDALDKIAQGRRGGRGRGPPGREGARGDHARVRGAVDELLKHKEAELLEV